MSGFTPAPGDPAAIMRDATHSEAIRRKLDMDALRKRLGDTQTKTEKLRESCEGFEAIFLQKMWEQMRKTVPKEGYLHSKDEEMYQSLFDIELCKKMASAGGIGLADMLYTQLSQQLENTGRTTSPSSYRSPLNITPSETLMAAAPAPPAGGDSDTPRKEQKELRPEDLYSPLENGEKTPPAPQNASALDDALTALRTDLGVPLKDPGMAAEQWANERAVLTGAIQPSSLTTLPAAPSLTPPSGDPAAPPAEVTPPEKTPANGQQPATATPQAAAATKTLPKDPSLASWQGPGPVSIKPKPSADAAKKPENATKRSMAPEGTLWPLTGQDSNVISRFGWEDDPATGKRRWNSGVRIEAAPAAPVRAVLPGTVVYAGQRDGMGHTVILEHKGGFRSYYGNLESDSVRVGEKIKHGAEFARIAAEPSSAPNGANIASLHFELKKGEMAINPESAIRRENTTAKTADKKIS